MADTEEKISKIFDLFDKFGHELYIGEKVTQLQHAQQAAKHAKDADRPEHIILGAFLHDVGHLVGLEKKMEQMVAEGQELGVKTHEKVGEEFLLELGFPKSVTDFVKGHVDAKRYLVFKDPEYHDTLSTASQGTLVNQGGPMTTEEAEEFEKHPDFEAIVEMRKWDDAAKEEDIPADESNDYYKELCRKILAAEA